MQIKEIELKIKDLEQLSYNIYQDEFAIDTEEMANECLQSLNENLKKVYDFILYNEEQPNEIDLYQIGDIINFLDTIKIVKE